MSEISNYLKQQEEIRDNNFEKILSYQENEWVTQRLDIKKQSKSKTLFLTIKNKIIKIFTPKKINKNKVDPNLYESIIHYKKNDTAIDKNYCNILDLLLLKLFSRKFKNKYIVTNLVDFVSYKEKSDSTHRSRHDNCLMIKNISPCGKTKIQKKLSDQDYINDFKEYQQKMNYLNLNTNEGIEKLLKQLELVGKKIDPAQLVKEKQERSEKLKQLIDQREYTFTVKQEENNIIVDQQDLTDLKRIHNSRLIQEIQQNLEETKEDQNNKTPIELKDI